MPKLVYVTYVFSASSRQMYIQYMCIYMDAHTHKYISTCPYTYISTCLHPQIHIYYFAYQLGDGLCMLMLYTTTRLRSRFFFKFATHNEICIVYIHVYIQYICMYIYSTYICLYIYMKVPTCVCMGVRMYIYICACVYIRIYVYTEAYITLGYYIMQEIIQLNACTIYVHIYTETCIYIYAHVHSVYKHTHITCILIHKTRCAAVYIHIPFTHTYCIVH